MGGTPPVDADAHACADIIARAFSSGLHRLPKTLVGAGLLDGFVYRGHRLLLEDLREEILACSQQLPGVVTHLGQGRTVEGLLEVADQFTRAGIILAQCAEDHT